MLKHGLCVKQKKKNKVEKESNKRSVLLCTADGEVIKQYKSLSHAVVGIKQSLKYGYIRAQMSDKGFYWVDPEHTQKLIKEFPAKRGE